VSATTTVSFFAHAALSVRRANAIDRFMGVPSWGWAGSVRLASMRPCRISFPSSYRILAAALDAIASAGQGWSLAVTFTEFTWHSFADTVTESRRQSRYPECWTVSEYVPALS
jgi:hypothetical protein